MARRGRVLVVEDETLVALLIEDMLEEIGCESAGLATSVAEGLRLAETADADIAILDVNLGGALVYPVAEALEARGVRIVFSTGYGSEGLPAEWRSRPVIAKPFLPERLRTVLRAVLEER